MPRLACILLLVLSLACRADPTVPTLQVASGLLPVVSVSSEELPMRVPFVLSNGTDQPMKYAVSPDGKGLVSLNGMLRQDGKPYQGAVIRLDGRSLREEHVRELKPHSHVVLSYTLLYPDIEPGRYELQLVYQVPKGSEYGLMAVKFEQTLILNVTK